MINVLFKTESHYLVNRKRIRKLIGEILEKEGVKTSVEIGVVVVGDRQMRKLNLKYRHLDETTDVLAFPLQNDGQLPFVDYPDKILRLGDIVISYPQARESAREENKLVDEKIDELVVHGLEHLLGKK